MQKVDLSINDYPSESKYFPKAAVTKQELNYENTMGWLKRANVSEDADYMDAYAYLSHARNGLRLDVNDSNLVAAERYASSFTGRYGRGYILGQDFLKKARSHPMIRKVFGKNGAPASDSEYITVWGFMGVA